jgi:hypothetical protein
MTNIMMFLNKIGKKRKGKIENKANTDISKEER